MNEFQIPADVRNYGTHQQLLLCPVSLDEALETIGLDKHQLSKENPVVLRGAAGWELPLADCTAWSTHKGTFPWDAIKEEDSVTLSVVAVEKVARVEKAPKRKAKRAGGKSV